MLRRAKKKEVVHSCIKFIGKLQRKVEEYEPKEDWIMSKGQAKKNDLNGRTQKIDEKWHKTIRLIETSKH